MRNLTEIRISGFGGQGVILSAIVIGKAGCIFENGYSTMTQAFGPEARGGACSAQVILSNEPILYPYVTQPDILVDDVAGGVRALHSAVEGRRAAHHRAGSGARRQSCPRESASMAFRPRASPKNSASAWCSTS